MTPYNILIVEDEKEILRFVRLALENEGFRVYDASECQRGLIEAASRKPDLVILDWDYLIKMGFALFKISANGVARRLLCYPPEILNKIKLML